MARGAHNWLVSRNHDEAIRGAVAAHARGRLIDIGCGEKPYASITKEFVTEHVGVDHRDSLHGSRNVDLDSTAYDIPVPDGSFDSALCTAVLEHLEEPERAIREAFRVLRPGGKAIYTVPLFWHLHEEPRDFFRFTKFGLRYLFEKVGFEVLELRPLSGIWVTLGQMLAYHLGVFDSGVVHKIRLMVPLYALVQAGALLLDKIDRAEQWTWAYLLVAQKPETRLPSPPLVNENSK